MKKNTKHTIGTILLLLGGIFLILSGVDSIIHQYTNLIVKDGIISTPYKLPNMIISGVSLVSIVLGKLLID